MTHQHRALTPPMPYVMHVRDVCRWWRYNEYEGEVIGELDGLAVTCHMIGPTAGTWALFHPGASVEVDAWAERWYEDRRDQPPGTGSTRAELRVLPPGTPPSLTGVDDCIVDVVGTVVRQDGEDVFLESVLPLRLDLDTAPRDPTPEVRAGDVIGVRCRLQIELPDAE